jgi:nicotinamidase-related amidase
MSVPETFNLLIIDPQNDFIDAPIDGNDKGRLAVTGANTDMDRIVQMINANKGKIKKIYVSLDTHTSNHIGHYFYRQLNTDGSLGDLAPPLTIYKVVDDKIIGEHFDFDTNTYGGYTQEYVVNVADDKDREIMNKYAKAYIEKLNELNNKELNELNKHSAITWPIHCIPRTGGWKISPTLQAALDNPEIKDKVEYHIKGQNQLAEMYSIMQAEVPYEKLIGGFNEDDQKVIKKYLYNPVDDINSDDREHFKYIKQVEDISKFESLNQYEPSSTFPDVENIKTSFNLQTTFNNDLFNKLTEGGASIVVCGEALSHCVKSSTEDIVKKIEDPNNPNKNKNKVYIVANGSSSVGNFEKYGTAFIKYMRENQETRGVLNIEANGTLNEDVSTQAVGGLRRTRKQNKVGKRTHKQKKGGKRSRKQNKYNKKRTHRR